MKKYQFESIIKASEIGKGGSYVEFPYDVKQEFGGAGRVKVICFFGDIEYRGSLVKMGTSCHILGISKEIRGKLEKTIGDSVQVMLYKDETERTVDVHPLLTEQFEVNQTLREKYEKLSYTRKKEIFNQLTDAKKAETLKSRLDKIIMDLMRG